MENVTVVECPRDAWQGLANIIPTEEKVKYLKSLVSLGFRHIDAVSFVSPKHVPQMADSEAVMRGLSGAKTPSGSGSMTRWRLCSGRSVPRWPIETSVVLGRRSRSIR